MCIFPNQIQMHLLFLLLLPVEVKAGFIQRKHNNSVQLQGYESVGQSAIQSDRQVVEQALRQKIKSHSLWNTTGRRDTTNDGNKWHLQLLLWQK